MKENGFTLVEMLVVLAIGAVLLTGIASVLGGFGDTLRRTSKADRHIAQMRGLDDIQQLLDGALYHDQDGKLYPQSATRLEFRTPARQALGKAGLRHVALIAARSNKTTNLLLDDLGNDLALPNATLVHGASEIAFESRSENEGAFQKPRMREVIITMHFASDAELKIVSIPHITTQGTCIFDPISQECRP